MAQPPTQEKWTGSMVGCLLLLVLIGFLFLAAALFGLPWGMGNFRGLVAVWSPDVVHTTGTVIRFDYAGRGRTGSMSAPVVQIMLDNRPFVFHAVASSFNDFEKGQQVPVAYLRSNPEDAWIRTFDQQYSLPLLCLLFSSPFLAVGARAVYVTMRSPRL